MSDVDQELYLNISGNNQNDILVDGVHLPNCLLADLDAGIAYAYVPSDNLPDIEDLCVWGLITREPGTIPPADEMGRVMVRARGKIERVPLFMME